MASCKDAARVLYEVLPLETSVAVWLWLDSGLLPPLLQSGSAVLVGFSRPVVAPLPWREGIATRGLLYKCHLSPPPLWQDLPLPYAVKALCADRISISEGVHLAIAREQKQPRPVGRGEKTRGFKPIDAAMLGLHRKGKTVAAIGSRAPQGRRQRRGSIRLQGNGAGNILFESRLLTASHQASRNHGWMGPSQQHRVCQLRKTLHISSHCPLANCVSLIHTSPVESGYDSVPLHPG